MGNLGKYFAFESLGTRDGPGIRSVLFLHGCNLRCCYCHNPEAFASDEYKMISVDELITKLNRYKPYYNKKGGLTLSGGEPLLQYDFVYEVAKKCVDNNINIAIDTSASFIPPNIVEILRLTNVVLLDIKMDSNEDYKKYIGDFEMQNIFYLLELCEKCNVNVVLRKVIIEGINDNIKDLNFLKHLKSKFSCISTIELLPFMNLCISKYEKLNLEFRLKNCKSTDNKVVEKLMLEL